MTFPDHPEQERCAYSGVIRGRTNGMITELHREGAVPDTF